MKAESGYTIKTGKEEMQPQRIHRWLSHRSYWAKDIPFDTFKTSIEHSFCIGVFYEEVQVGFARFVTDYAVFAYLADVYVEEEHRRKGLSKWMIDTLMNQPWVKNLRRISLATKDAHGLYAGFGFRPLAHPDRMMEIVQSDIYQKHFEQNELPSIQH